MNWWRILRPARHEPEELERDTYALGPLTMIGAHEDGKRVIERYRFEPQEHRISLGDNPVDPEAETGPGLRSRRGHRARFRAWPDHAVAHAGQMARGAVRFLIPSAPFGTDAQEDALLDLGRWVAANGPNGPGRNRAGRDLLMRLPPRLSGGDGHVRFAARRDCGRSCDSLDTEPARWMPAGAGSSRCREDAYGGARGAAL